MAVDFLRFGLFIGASALVLSNDVPEAVKFVARIAKRFLGPRIQICDGVEDDIEAQAAHDALPAAGGREVFTAGSFRFGPTVGTLAMDRAKVTTQGQGASTRIEVVLNTPGTNDTIYVTGDHCTVLDLHIEGGGALGTASGNHAVSFRDCDFGLAERVTTHDTKLMGVVARNCKYVTFRSCGGLDNGGTTGTGCAFYFGDLCEDCLCEDCVGDGSVEWNFRTYDNGDGPPVRCTFRDCVSLRSGSVGFNFGDCVGLRAFNCKSYDETTFGFANTNSPGSHFDNCEARGNTGGFRFLATAHMVDCLAEENDTFGFHFRGNGTTLTTCQAWNNGQGLAGEQYGFQPQGVSNGVMVGCIASDDQGVKTQTHGIDFDIGGGGVIGLQVIGGSLDGNLTGPVNNFQASARFVSVHGFTTENSGSDSIGAAAVAVNVNHGLDVTPQAGDVMVTPTNNMGNATKMWISAYAAATFTVTIDVVPGGVDTADFAWRTMVLPH